MSLGKLSCVAVALCPIFSDFIEGLFKLRKDKTGI